LERICRQLMKVPWPAILCRLMGGIIGLTREVDKDTAVKLASKFYEIIVAPGFSTEAVEVFKEKRPNLRLISFDLSKRDELRLTKTAFGFWRRKT